MAAIANSTQIDIDRPHMPARYHADRSRHDDVSRSAAISSRKCEAVREMRMLAR